MKRKMLCGVIAAAVCLSSAGLGLTAINKTTAKAQDAGYKTVYDFTAVTDVASVTDFRWASTRKTITPTSVTHLTVGLLIRER